MNAVRDRRRIRPATPPAAPSDPDPAPSGGDPDVRALVARLPERQRLVLFLRYYADPPGSGMNHQT